MSNNKNMIRLIAAVDRKFGIAKHGGQPWHIPEDEAYFSRQTKSFGGKVLMGSTTLSVMGKPLQGRTNYVLSRSLKDSEGVKVVTDLEKFIKDAQDEDIWVIGGASIFKQVIDLGAADELYLTHIDADFNCDQFFPEIPQDKYVLGLQSETKNQNGFSFSYAVYKKK